jgi:hypothetical protein
VCASPVTSPCRSAGRRRDVVSGEAKAFQQANGAVRAASIMAADPKLCGAIAFSRPAILPWATSTMPSSSRALARWMLERWVGNAPIEAVTSPAVETFPSSSLEAGVGSQTGPPIA